MHDLKPLDLEATQKTISRLLRSNSCSLSRLVRLSPYIYAILVSTHHTQYSTVATVQSTNYKATV